MSLSATLFGTDSLIFKATNILGLGIPGLLHKTFGPGEPEAQRLGEISRQTAKEGEPRVIVWGRVRPIGGNVIHCQKPKKRMVKQSSSGGGKGGSKKKEQKVEHVFRSYAIGVCEGPITGFSRIWRNNKLVYDARGNAWGKKNNPVFLKTFRLYLGGWNQVPDPTLQSIWGAGNVPAYRGTAYMVALDEDLTDQGGMVPQWLFEVERAEGSYLTSKPYNVETAESIGVAPGADDVLVKDVIVNGFGAEHIAVSPAVDEILLVGPQESREYVGVTPAVDEIILSEQVRQDEAVAVTPAIDSILYSISYQSQEPDALGVVPAIDEVILE